MSRVGAELWGLEIKSEGGDGRKEIGKNLLQLAKPFHPALQHILLLRHLLLESFEGFRPSVVQGEHVK